MAERPSAKPEIASQKLAIKLAPSLGDWTTYRPQKILVKKVKTGLYGFDRLSKEELALLLRIHYDFVQALLARLKVDLGMGVEFFSCQVEQTTYLNFLRTLTGAAVQGKISLPVFHEGVQVFLDLPLASSLINHALGSQDTEALNRRLTEAENTVLSTAVTEYLPLYLNAFGNIFDNPVFTPVSSPDVTLDPSINTSATFVSFAADVALSDNPPGKIIFGYLAGPLKGLLKTYQEKERTRPLNFGRLSSAVLNKLTVPLTAVLGQTDLLTSELKLLEVGDVVSLSSPINSAIVLSIGDLLKVKAQPGIRNKKKAVRVAGLREDEEVEIAPPLAVEAEKPAAPPPAAPAEVAAPAPPAVEGPLPAEEPAQEEEFPEDEFNEEDLFSEEEFPAEETNTGEV